MQNSCSIIFVLKTMRFLALSSQSLWPKIKKYHFSMCSKIFWVWPFFRRSCLSSLLTYISVLWRLSGISEIRRSIGWFHKHWKWRVGKQRKSRFRLDEPETRETIKATLLYCMCFTKFCFVRRLNFGVLVSKVFFIETINCYVSNKIFYG